MKLRAGLSVALVLPLGLLAQQRGGYGHSGNFPAGAPRTTGGFGSVVFPGGTPATQPGIHRSFGSVVFPGGGGPHLVVPGTITDPTFSQRLGQGLGGHAGDNGQPRRGDRGRSNGRNYGYGYGYSYAYPVIAPGYYGDYGYGNSGYPPDAAPPQTPNITIIYSPQPLAIGQLTQGGPEGANPDSGQAGLQTYQAPHNQPAAPAETQYIFAFKDHTVYSAIAYWVDGDTLHYFTTGNQHNQASLSLLDRPLTAKLNKEAGVEVVLPPAK